MRHRALLLGNLVKSREREREKEREREREREGERGRERERESRACIRWMKYWRIYVYGEEEVYGEKGAAVTANL